MSYTLFRVTHSPLELLGSKFIYKAIVNNILVIWWIKSPRFTWSWIQTRQVQETYSGHSLVRLSGLTDSVMSQEMDKVCPSHLITKLAYLCQELFPYCLYLWTNSPSFHGLLEACEDSAFSEYFWRLNSFFKEIRNHELCMLYHDTFIVNWYIVALYTIYIQYMLIVRSLLLYCFELHKIEANIKFVTLVL